MRYFIATVSLLFLLCACGQKGPLILPEEEITPPNIEVNTETNTDSTSKNKTEASE